MIQSLRDQQNGTDGGGDERTGSLFSYADLEAPVGNNHPLRTIRSLVNEALSALSPDFSAMYSRMGWPSIPPDKLLRAMLLQEFYSVCSERLLMEWLEFDLLFRWFVGIGVDGAARDHSSKPNARLIQQPARWKKATTPIVCWRRGVGSRP